MVINGNEGIVIGWNICDALGDDVLSFVLFCDYVLLHGLGYIVFVVMFGHLIGGEYWKYCLR